MMRIGITGQNGFIGTHIRNHLFLYREEFEVVPFENSFFESGEQIDRFVAQCDVVIHLAAKNRHADPAVLHETNVSLVRTLIDSLVRTGNKAHVVFSSSSQEQNDNLYGQSKKEGRELFANWAKKYQAKFTGVVIPNVFGPFCLPRYNSFIATFCHQLIRGEAVTIEKDAEIKLIYVAELVNEILQIIRKGILSDNYTIQHTFEIKVSAVLQLLRRFHEAYLVKNTIPVLNNSFELNLFNTFRAYNILENNPVSFVKHEDDRGMFVELIKLENGGQVSFSTTNPGITRGNHFHTRKIERFAVIKGEALIQLRRIGTTEVQEYRLSGETPAYVDMPTWYTHNIKNVGADILYTVFWINEIYDSADPDTFFEQV